MANTKTTSGPAGRLASGRPSRTAEITAQLRASDAKLRPSRRLLGDQYAKLFVRNPRYKLLRLTPTSTLFCLRAFDRTHGGFTAEIVLRTKHFDDVLIDAYARGIRQVVLLGAGYDSTALRHPEMSDARFFEVDHPATQGAKLEVLRQYNLRTPNVSYTALDLTGWATLPAALEEAGFDRGQPCLVGWHGVVFFLPREAFMRSLRQLAEICAPGSRLVFDYMDESVVNGTTTYKGALRGAANVAKAGESYRNGLTPTTAAEAAAEAGFTCVENIRVRDLVRRYGGARPYCRDDDFMGIVTVER